MSVNDPFPANPGNFVIDVDGTKALYEIIKTKNQGNNTWIYGAKDLLNSNRLVALKILKHNISEANVRGFFKETNLVHGLDHPNIYKVFDASKRREREDAPGPTWKLEEQDNQKKIIGYCAAEDLGHDDLRLFLDPAKRLTADAVIDIAIQLAQALEYLHGKRIFHLDLKPGNLMLKEEKSGEKIVKVIDFGYAREEDSDSVAKFLEAMDSDDLSKRSFEPRGTIGYASPEQQDGIDMPDHRDDIFAFGVVLYELLVGKHPFRRFRLHPGNTLDRDLTRGNVRSKPTTYHTDFEKATEGCAALRTLIGRMLGKHHDLRPQRASDILISLLAIRESRTTVLKGEIAKTASPDASSSLEKPLQWTVEMDGKAHLFEALRDWVDRSSKFKIEMGDTHCELSFTSTMIDPTEVGTGLFQEVAKHLAAEPSMCARVWAVHRVTEKDGDEEFNFWRSAKAISYLEAQKDLLENGKERAAITRYFATPGQGLCLRALAVVANQVYWGIKAYHAHGSNQPKLPSPAENVEKLLLIHFGPREEAFGPDGVVAPKPIKNGFVLALYENRSSLNGRERDATACGICWTKSEDNSMAHQILKYMREHEIYFTSDQAEPAVLMDADHLDEHLGKLRDRPRRRDSRAGSYLAFRVARSRLERAQYVLAVDKTAVKNSVNVLKQDPGYQEWQAAQLKTFESRDKFHELRRIFVVGDHDQADAIKWLCRRYSEAAKGMDVAGKVHLRYVLAENAKKKIWAYFKERPEEARSHLAAVTSELEKRDRAFLDESGPGGMLDPEQEEYWSQVVMRDFVVTDNMVYDYINPDAQVDAIAAEDYWLVPGGYARFEEIQARYTWIFECLWSLSERHWDDAKGEWIPVDAIANIPQLTFE